LISADVDHVAAALSGHLDGVRFAPGWRVVAAHVSQAAAG
jgi:hypothetical protein